MFRRIVLAMAAAALLPSVTAAVAQDAKPAAPAPAAAHFTRQADRLQFLQELEAFLAKYNPA